MCLVCFKRDIDGRWSDTSVIIIPDSILVCSVFDTKILSIRVAVVSVIQVGLVMHGNMLFFRFNFEKIVSTFMNIAF